MKVFTIFDNFHIIFQLKNTISFQQCKLHPYDLLSTIWKGKDHAFIEVVRHLTEEVDRLHFEIILNMELFLDKMLESEWKKCYSRGLENEVKLET